MRQIGLRFQLEQVIFLILLVLMLVPVFENQVFFTLDGPAHLYNSQILKEMLLGNGSMYEKYLTLNTRPEPNWIGHALLTVLLFLFKPFVAEKVLVALYVLAFMFGFRYLVSAFKKTGLWTSYFGFALVYSFPLFIGFFNFCFGLAASFFLIGFWIRHSDHLTQKRAFQFLALFLIGFFSHITTYAITLMCLSVFELTKLIGSIIEGKIVFRKTILRYVVLLLTALPSLALAVYFFQGHGGGDISANTASIEQQWHELFSLRPIHVFSLMHEEPISKWVFPSVIITCFLVLILGFFNYQRTNGILNFQFDVRKGIFQYRHTFLLLSALFLSLYFLLPDEMSSGGYVHIRLLLVFLIMLFLWLATSKIPLVVGLPLILVVLTTNYRLIDFRRSFVKEQNAMVAEIISSVEHIPEGSVVLPIVENHHWFYGHVSNYLGTIKPMIILDNYEASTGYFPLNWKPGIRPAHTLGFPMYNCCGESVLRLEDEMGMVDIIVHYSDSTADFGTECGLTVEQLEALDYDAVFTSKTGNLKVFKRSEKAHSGGLPELNFPDTQKVIHRNVFATSLEGDSAWDFTGIVDYRAHSGINSSLINAADRYGPALEIPIKKLGPAGKKMLHLSYMVWSEKAFPKLSTAYSYRNTNGDYGHAYIPCGYFVRDAEKWVKVEALVELNKPENQEDNWIIYPYSMDDIDVFIDDLRYEIITLNE